MTRKKIRMKSLIFIIFGLSLFIFLLVEALIIYTGNRAYKEASYDYIIVLGAKVNGDKPCLALKYRLDAALDYLKNNDDVNVIVSGGKGIDESYPESQVMKDYLIKNGIAAERIIEESKSTTTNENFSFSHEITGDANILVATNDFHMFRALGIAKRHGYNAEPLNAETPNIIKIQMHLREFPATILSYLFGI